MAMATETEQQLREEIERLKEQLAHINDEDESPSSINEAPPPQKSGYLFKWQDRSIGTFVEQNTRFVSFLCELVFLQ